MVPQYYPQYLLAKMSKEISIDSIGWIASFKLTLVLTCLMIILILLAIPAYVVAAVGFGGGSNPFDRFTTPSRLITYNGARIRSYR